MSTVSSPSSRSYTSSQFLLQHFDRLAEAPGGVARLREAILELAVQGKLVERHASDESASELLGRIKSEKDRRIKAGMLIKHETLPAVRSDEQRYLIPTSWVWTRLGTITEVLMGQSPPGETYNKTGEGIPLINGPVEFTAGPFGKTVINQYTTAPRNLCEEGDLLLCVRGSTTGRTNIAAFKACIGRGVAAIRPFFANEYVRLFIWRLRASIIAMGRGIAFPSVTRKQIAELPVPLPPLAEQRRIVAKVEELMGLCDALEAAQREREAVRTRLRTSALHQLASPDSDSHSAAFVLRNLTCVSVAQEDVGDIRESMLQLILLGKLTRGRADKPSGIQLAQELRLEHRNRWAGKKAAYKAPPQIERSGLPLIPDSWEWAPLELVCPVIIDSPHRTPHYSKSGGHFALRPRDVSNGVLNLSRAARVDDAEFEKQTLRRKPVVGDIVYSRELSFGWAIIIPLNISVCLSQGMVSMRTHEQVLTDYFVTLLNSRLVRSQAQEAAIGAAHPHVNLADIRTFKIPLPPPAEQRRIVAKVDELMAVLDALEAALTTVRTTAEKLLAATVAGLNEPTANEDTALLAAEAPARYGG